MRYPVYPEYKESGVQWLGQVPEHWEVKRLKDVGSLMAGAGFPHEFQGIEDEKYPFFKVGDLANSSDGRKMIRGEHSISRKTASILRARIIPPNAIIYAKIRAALLLNRRRITAIPCCIDNNMTAFVPTAGKIDTTFSFYWFSTLDFGEFTNPGAVPSLSEGYQSILPITLPPLPEQTAIANFLDRETGRIDTLVAKKRRLIALLKEKRTVLISRAVTRGLPASVAREFGLEPHTRFKDSGIVWLGQVPEGCEVKKLGFITKKIGSGKTPSGGAETYVDEGIMFLRSQNVYDEGLNLEDVVYIDEGTDADMATSRVQPKDILLNITGASLGRTCIVPDEFSRANVNQHVCIIRMSNLKHSVFISWLMKSAGIKAQIQNAQTGAAREGLNFEQITNLVFVLPLLSEQTAIATYLDRETAKIDRLVEKVELLISRLQEYRAALITATVTGKIDVRSCTSQEVST